MNKVIFKGCRYAILKMENGLVKNYRGMRNGYKPYRKRKAPRRVLSRMLKLEILARTLLPTL